MRAAVVVSVAVFAMVGVGVASAEQGRVRILDIGADLNRGGHLFLEAETRGATRMTFTYRGRQFTGRVVDSDFEDGTRDWGHVARASGSDRNGGRRVTIGVRACRGSSCVSRSSSEFLERPEFDDDDDDD